MKPEMETQPEAGQVIEDARALLTVTTQVAEEKVVAARERLAQALEKAKKVCDTVQAQAVAGAKATDQVIRTHPYQTMGVALGVGAVIGYLLARRSH